MPSITLLNETGDVTISWDDYQNEKMRELIQRKLDQGYAFFIIKRKFYGLMENKKQLRSISDLNKDARDITFRDEDAIELLQESQNIHVETVDATENFESIGSSRDVEEIAKSDTLVVRQIAGG